MAYVRTRMASARGAKHDFGRLFVPVQQKLKDFLTTLPEYPFQQGSSLNAAGINYNSLQALQAMKRLKELESLRPPSN